MAGSPGDRHADRGTAPPALSLRQLGAARPSFDQALDDLIARAHRTELAVGDDDVIAAEPAALPDPDEPGASSDAIARPTARQVFLDAKTDPLGDRRIGHGADDASLDAVTDPYATDPYADPTRSDGAVDATTDPFADPTRRKPRDDGEDPAEAYDLALRGQLAGLQRRLAAAEANEPALREQLAGLQRRLAAAEARVAGTGSYRRRIGLAVALGFAAGLAAMFAVSRLASDRDAAPIRSRASASDLAPSGAAPATEPIVTPIDPPTPADPSSGSSSGASRGSSPTAPTARRPGPSPSAGGGAAAAAPAKSASTTSGSTAPDATRPEPRAPGATGAGSGSGLVDPFSGPAGSPPGAPPAAPPADAPPRDAPPRDAGAIVNPFGDG